VVINLKGPAVRVLLNRGLPIDLDSASFPVDSFAQSLIDHIPVLVHRAGADDVGGFDVYVPREYAVSFWEWLTDAAEPLGCEIGKSK
jgi:sarcosine oxidase subunit gamma